MLSVSAHVYRVGLCRCLLWTCGVWRIVKHVTGCHHREMVCGRPCVEHVPIPTCRDPDEPWNRSGVNALQIDPLTRRLYTAGRDSIIRTSDISDNKEVDAHTHTHTNTNTHTIRSYPLLSSSPLLSFLCLPPPPPLLSLSFPLLLSTSPPLPSPSYLSLLFLSFPPLLSPSPPLPSPQRPQYVRAMEHHTDWVNDIVLCQGGRNSECVC